MSDVPEILTPDPSLPSADQPGLALAALTLYGEARGEKAMGKKAIVEMVKGRIAPEAKAAPTATAKAAKKGGKAA